MVVVAVVWRQEARPYCGEMNNAGDGNDEKADDDGGDSNVERVPAQPPGPVVVPLVITLSGLRARKISLWKVQLHQQIGKINDLFKLKTLCKI